MKHQAPRNHLKIHRKKSGLSQREIGLLLGYKDPGQISRHERSSTIPPLAVALAYESIFRVPVSTIFSGMHGSIERDIEDKLRNLEATLENRSAIDRDANLVAHKLLWLTERKNR
jgi:transcriptional regulator with XRE-family HTH domain